MGAAAWQGTLVHWYTLLVWLGAWFEAPHRLSILLKACSSALFSCMQPSWPGHSSFGSFETAAAAGGDSYLISTGHGGAAPARLEDGLKWRALGSTLSQKLFGASGQLSWPGLVQGSGMELWGLSVQPCCWGGGRPPSQFWTRQQRGV